MTWLKRMCPLPKSRSVREFCPDLMAPGCLSSTISDARYIFSRLAATWAYMRSCMVIRIPTKQTDDLCSDAPAPSWEELESVMLAVKLVVHGLVEFIQNFSKKSHDTPQVHQWYKEESGTVISLRTDSRMTHEIRRAAGNVRNHRHNICPVEKCRKGLSWGSSFTVIEGYFHLF